jgi:hypothetical protein
MEDPATPWLIAEATTAGLSVLWVWVTLLAGTAVVVTGGILFCHG